MVDPAASVDEVVHAVELLVHGGSTEDDDRVGHKVDALPVPVHESVMVVGPATVLEFDQMTELNADDERLELPVPVSVMVDTDREPGGASVELEAVVSTGEELVMIDAVPVADEEAALLSEPVTLMITVVVTELSELVEAVPVAVTRTLSEDRDTVGEDKTDAEVSEVLVKCV